MNSRSPLGPEEDMIGRVARAICELDFRERNVDHWDGDWEIFVPHARAAIEAMREPTEDMLMDGQVEIVIQEMIDGEDQHICRDDLAKGWRKMIDAVLSSSPKGGSPNLPKQR